MSKCRSEQIKFRAILPIPVPVAARLRCGSAAACLLGLGVRIPPGVWMSVCCECCVLADRGLCDELITRPEESYRLCVCLSVIVNPV